MRRIPLLLFGLILGAAVLTTPAQAQQPEFSSDLPGAGGVALVSSSGGTVEDLAAAAAANGCDLASVWVSTDGTLVGHVVGAPPFVNADFTEAVGTEIAPGAPLVLRCTSRPSAIDAQVPFASVVPDWIEDLHTESDTHLPDPEVYSYFATWPVIDSFALLGEEVQAEIDAARQAFEERISPTIPDAPVTPEFNVTFDFIAASGTVIGVRVARYEFFGANGAELAQTLWFDTATNRRVPSTALLDGDAALAEVAELAREALSRDRADLSLPDLLEEGTAPTDQNYDSIGFTARGDLLIEFDEFQVGPGASGSPRVIIPASIVSPLLSEFGQRAQEEVVDSSGALTLPSATPPPAPSPEPEVNVPPASVDCQQVACVALTFDDGPARTTARLLDLLTERGARGTFFVIGSNVRFRPELLKRMVDEGHEVGNHTLDHRDLTKLGADELTEQVTGASQAIEQATGHAPRLLRPPYGAVDEHVSSTVSLPLILWSVDPRDWADHDASLVAQRVASEAQRGSIVLLHDIHDTTVEAIPAILDDLERRGLTAVTVSELLGLNLEAGRPYRSQ